MLKIVTRISDGRAKEGTETDYPANIENLAYIRREQLNTACLDSSSTTTS